MRKNGKTLIIGELEDANRFGNLCQLYGMLAAASKLMQEAQLLAILSGSAEVSKKCSCLDDSIGHVKGMVCESVDLMMRRKSQGGP